MQRRIIFVLVAAVVAALLPAVAAQAAPKCFGRAATIVGTSGSEKLVGTPGPDVIVGRYGNDEIHGRGGRDRICGGQGEDRLYGGGGDDKIHAGRGDESGRGAWLFGGGGNDLLLGGQFGDGERLYGGPGNDTLNAFDCYEIYTDELYGGDGNDILTQGAGEAWLAPGLGDDRVEGGSREPGDAPATEDRAQDYLDLTDAPGPLHVDLAAGTASGQGSDEIDNVEVVLGGEFDDRLIGGGSKCCIQGRYWYHAPAVLYGMNGSDILSGGDGDDSLFGEGAETFANAMSSPYLGGEPGNDALVGGGGDDSLRGGVGDDLYVGGEGKDTASFAGSETAVTVDLAARTASGEGNDELRAIEKVIGTDFADTLIGDEGDNVLYGAAGTNTVEGAGGNDTLEVFGSGGGSGGQTLRGGPGSDGVRYACAGTQRPPLEVDLATGADNVGNTLTQIENVWSDCRGVINGNDAANQLFIRGEMNGGGGDDVLQGFSTDDILNGGEGNDVLDGRGGTDACTDGETVINCEA